MAENPQVGTVALTVGGQTFTLQMTIDRLAELYALHNTLQIRNACIGMDMNALLTGILIAMKNHHPDMNLEKFKALNPAAMELVEPFDRVLRYAYFGPTGEPPKETTERQKKVTAAAANPKTHKAS